MFHYEKYFAGCFLALLITAVSARGQAPLTINGIADQGDYSDTATLSVPSTAGYSYSIKFDGNPIPTDQSLVVTNQDYHQLVVWRTNLTTLAVTNRLIRFIVEHLL